MTTAPPVRQSTKTTVRRVTSTAIQGRRRMAITALPATTTAIPVLQMRAITVRPATTTAIPVRQMTAIAVRGMTRTPLLQGAMNQHLQGQHQHSRLQAHPMVEVADPATVVAAAQGLDNRLCP